VVTQLHHREEKRRLPFNEEKGVSQGKRKDGVGVFSISGEKGVKKKKIRYFSGGGEKKKRGQKPNLRGCIEKRSAWRKPSTAKAKTVLIQPRGRARAAESLTAEKGTRRQLAHEKKKAGGKPGLAIALDEPYSGPEGKCSPMGTPSGRNFIFFGGGPIGGGKGTCFR